MAEASTSSLKRPHPDEDQQSAHKKSRSNNGSPIPLANGSAPTGKPDVSKIMAEARARAAAAAAKLRGPGSPAPQSPSPASTPAASGSAMDRIAQMKARVAAATQKTNASTQQRTAAPAPTYQPPVYEDTFSRARGGLDVGLHPALMGDSGQDAKSSKGRQAMQPKFATTMANRRPESPVNQSSKTAKGKQQLDLSGPSLEETRSNPYFDASLGPKTATAKARKSKQLVFNQKGKYIQQAAALRRQAALEAMKKRIAESSRKVGIDEDLDTEKAFIVEKPPEIEWWDEGLVKDGNYDSIDSPTGLKLDTSDSIVTVYIQHPVALEPPSQQLLTVQKPLPLTSTEAAKVRRQRRMENLKEEQAKIRLGLVPAPPPKVKLGNLMRVLGEEAVRDPTKVEAQVREQVAARAKAHADMNEERKLSKEQQHAKLTTKQAQDVAKGVHICVYKVDNLSNGRHRFKINKNAEQHALVGICLISPKFSLVIVEGGIHSIAAYKKLMLNRIDWTENSAPNPVVREGNKEALAGWLNAEDENGQLKDLTANNCQLLFEGEEKQRGFRRWFSRVVETDKEAMDVLRKAKMETFWVQAKGMP